jgi:hypothetical protein
MSAMNARSDPSTLDLAAIDSALGRLEREYHHASFTVERGDLDDVPIDVAAWWRTALRRRIELIRAEPPGPLYVTDDIEPMERRKDWLRKPGPPRG